jgi:hypothetical protein
VTFRRFVDKDGTSWEVWEVVPAGVDRRRGERRVRGERRRTARPSANDRRLLTRRVRTSGNYLRVTPGFERGWLCFSAGADIRRLAPIPSDWDNAHSQQLEMWVTKASPSWRCSSSESAD